jgi:hypothetical protein
LALESISWIFLRLIFPGKKLRQAHLWHFPNCSYLWKQNIDIFSFLFHNYENCRCNFRVTHLIKSIVFVKQFSAAKKKGIWIEITLNVPEKIASRPWYNVMAFIMTLYIFLYRKQTCTVLIRLWKRTMC